MVEISEEIAVYAYGSASSFKLLSQDISKQILSDLVRKNVAEFSDKFFHFQCANVEIFKGVLNNYSVLKLVFNQYPLFCNVLKNVSYQYYATNQETKPHILL